MNIVNLIGLIRTKPAMYISYHTISALKAFIDGWYFRNTNEDVEITILQDFEIWLRNHFNLDDKRSWDRMILFYSQDEHHALNRFFELFDDFLLGKQTIK